MVRSRLVAVDPSGQEFTSMRSHLTLLENEMAQRQGKAYQGASGAYPNEVAKFSSFLVRGGYIERITKLLPAEWAKMSQAELTAFLSKTYSEQDLVSMFLQKYDKRMEIKATFRKLNIVSALVIGLIWAAREHRQRRLDRGAGQGRR